MKMLIALLAVCGWIMIGAEVTYAETCSVTSKDGSTSCHISCPASEEDKMYDRDNAICTQGDEVVDQMLHGEGYKSIVRCECK